MDRRCFSCVSKFSVFKKECGCKSCGHSFCAGCLGFSAVLPTYGNTKQKICKKCYETISRRVAALEAKQNQQNAMQRGPGSLHVGANMKYQGLSPEDRAIAERLEKLKQETKPKTICSTAEIESRIEALRKETQPPAPSVQEMEDRLAILQGRMPPSGTSKPIHQPADTRTQTQKVDELLAQLTDEVAIDNQWDPATQPPESTAQATINNLSRADERDCWPGLNMELNADQLDKEKDKILKEAAAELRDENTRQEKMLVIAKRLATLQGKDPDKVTLDNCNLYDSDEETEEEAVQRILKQLSEEVILDEASGYNILPDQSRTVDNSRGRQAANKLLPAEMATVPIQPARSAAVKPIQPDSDEDELPWCCICNGDAALRCHDCDDDLYCKRCFREGHDEFDRKEHQTSPYRPLRKKKGR
ncbi:abscission/NoCut checkpoint regulator isoform X2 [Pseudophryne corroboree]|uniref:abscission/NoCut checkpoint regulator isoform X2 n=1 Tax=Pseudophryne corroboree TaxID=495146 RepID=UPI003081F40B